MFKMLCTNNLAPKLKENPSCKMKNTIHTETGQKRGKNNVQAMDRIWHLKSNGHNAHQEWCRFKKAICAIEKSIDLQLKEDTQEAEPQAKKQITRPRRENQNQEQEEKKAPADSTDASSNSSRQGGRKGRKRKDSRGVPRNRKHCKSQ